MSKESWYKSKLSDMDVVRIDISDDFVVDYDKSRGMYRVSIFKDNHFQDEYWFDAYEDKEVDGRIEKIIEFLESLKYYLNISNNLPKYKGVFLDPIDFRSDEERAIDLLDDIIKYIKEME